MLRNGILDENPTFIQVVGMCPVLAVTTQASNAIGMGLATTAVLAASNAAISLLRKVVPEEVRIPCFVVIIASFVTVVESLLAGFMPELNDTLGIYIPLIVVNCIILARAEAFAFKNNAWLSLWDGLGMGLGFTLALLVIGVIRELLGKGKVFGLDVLPAAYPGVTIMILAPGAFLTLGCLMALLNHFRKAAAKKAEEKQKAGEPA
jgi:electron transport complex protein RnfE